jgi:outer membrane cobalamin receptor
MVLLWLVELLVIQIRIALVNGIKKAEIVKKVSSSLSGSEALGGVVNSITKKYK